MAYKHILVAVDRFAESRPLMDKAVSLARLYNAKLSLIHVDVEYTDLYTGLFDVNLSENRKRTEQALNELAESTDYSVSEILTGRGDPVQVLEHAIRNYGIDIMVCGHHQDFLSKLISSARQLINNVPIDVLIIPLRDKKD